MTDADLAADLEGIMDSLRVTRLAGDVTLPALTAMTKKGIKSPDLRTLFHTLATAYITISKATAPQFDVDNAAAMSNTLRAFVKQEGFPYDDIFKKWPKSMNTQADILVIMSWLVSLVQASRIQAVHQGASESKMIVERDEESMRATNQVRTICHSLGIDSTGCTDGGLLLGSAAKKLANVVDSLPADYLQPRIFDGLTFTPAQEEKLREISQALFQEYSIRRSMLVKRLDVTAQSFLWSKKGQQHEDDIKSVFLQQRGRLLPLTRFTPYDVITARRDLTIVNRVTSGKETKGTSSGVKDLRLTVNIPDRGGRPGEGRKPTSGPAFKPRSSNSGSGASSPKAGAFRGGRGGGRVQGGWGGKKGQKRGGEDGQDGGGGKKRGGGSGSGQRGRGGWGKKK